LKAFYFFTCFKQNIFIIIFFYCFDKMVAKLPINFLLLCKIYMTKLSYLILFRFCFRQHFFWCLKFDLIFIVELFPINRDHTKFWISWKTDFFAKRIKTLPNMLYPFGLSKVAKQKIHWSLLYSFKIKPFQNLCNNVNILDPHLKLRNMIQQWN
jgi:hypothetical protein